MEAPQHQRRSLEGTGGYNSGLNYTGCQKRGTPNSLSHPTSGTFSRRTDPRPGVNETEANGSASSVPDKSTMSPSWGEQIEGALRVQRLELQQALAHDSDHNGSATNNEEKDACLEGTKVQNVTCLAVDSPSLAAEVSQPNVAPANTREERDVNPLQPTPMWLNVLHVVLIVITAILLAVVGPVFVVCVLVTRILMWIMSSASAIILMCCGRGGQISPLPTVGGICICIAFALVWVYV